MDIARLPLALLVAATIAAPARGDDFEARLDALPIVDEIDAATAPPVHEFPAGIGRTAPILGRPARLLGVGDEPRGSAWVIGAGKGLKPGAAYLLEIEYPDDVPRALFIANRGADHVRGFATGTAAGDARQQYVQPSLESLAYPQSGTWRVHRSLFFLHDRFQGLHAVRNPEPGCRPFAPDDGFHVIVFQTKRLNDPRSEGVAIGKIRLRSVPDPAALDADVEFPPADLPRRRVFHRDEMADEPISAREAADRGADPIEWYLYQAKIDRILGINTFAKDLLEFGHNQGWESGDPDWVVNAQPPLVDLWDRLVPRVAAEGLDLLPYYEYKGALGMESARPRSLGWERRAEKLYHGRPNAQYTGVWWTEQHNADLTDPDTLADARRVLDRTILAHKGRARFVGAWFRTRDNHLPISFADAAIARFREASPGDKDADRDALIASHEGDRKLYDRYIAWWLDRRAAFLEALADHLAEGLGDESAELLFTPWTGEQIPMLRDSGSGSGGNPVQIATDDPAWWDAFAREQEGSWFRWALSPTPYGDVVKRGDYAASLRFIETIAPPHRSEHYHSAPTADPERYAESRRVMMTFPIGRLFTVEPGALMESYRTKAGLTAIRHYALNEDNHERDKGPSDLPFDGQVGYICVDVDRAGPFVRLMEARAVAKADPTNLGMLCASAFSTGFPAEIRRFNQAYLAVPALPSRVVPGCEDPEVVVREIPAGSRGTYYYVVNTSMRPKSGVEVSLPATGEARDLVERRDLPGGVPPLDLEPGELRSYRVLAR